MKLLIVIFTLMAAQFSFAKARNIEFNQLIEKQVKSQIETHSALTKDINPSQIESSPADSNRIILSRQPMQMESSESKEKIKKVRISSTEQIEENDYNRLDRELGNGN